ncbi:MAG: DUF445 family protein [Candidatus Sumerlaeaceae bacterium]|nr:DUF445 family protein [Candidatus Sumerlaeaceae bacterium]
MSADLSNWVYWTLPIVGGLNGWFTTFLAIRMLFRPRKPVRILGFSYLAPLPKRQLEIAGRIGHIVETELLNYRDLRQQVVTPEFLGQIQEAIGSKIGDMLAERRKQLPRLVQKLVTDDLLEGVRKAFSNEIAGHLPELVDRMFDLLSENVSIQRLVAEKVAAFELEKLEEVVFSLAARELRLIELFCGALGFCIGVLQMMLTPH